MDIYALITELIYSMHIYASITKLIRALYPNKLSMILLSCHIYRLMTLAYTSFSIHTYRRARRRSNFTSRTRRWTAFDQHRMLLAIQDPT